ncbi:MAG: YifB family Mg chelatase-like AAA ATPase [Phenylobacterium sp.]|uniref:YifB family Mg chelatase-like AAA ATPase n=1 Tax=Phenylobacterium sp. TaxID=1871053 RepID=UPI001B407CFE|nr:YifB family Mg chelatase-like AAA ATPase [Phenylobacterium sp.]MBP7648715.1 YifB family Mg chelatase-like AAA ATPase [Phenylobacterium sp.]MBP7817642.1 YifB family Mg chelatase-like AAA ATPase [Phenylobacterium sp.]MBP9231019.1 YifB family Mg chelatase-like AAA ATPase [Phenylobacterium sp.]MBP9754127.1 YifB family Mg chelatase-like AAA ATPase [Phenylobacterium sp.]
MAARVVTLAFQGVEARRVDVEVQLTGGEFAFIVVGLGDKAVGESRERVRAAFSGLGLSLPGKRIIVNLAPADLPKEGSHYDLPIALAVMAAMGIIPLDRLTEWAAMGELSLDGRIVQVAGALPASVAAGALGLGLICPEACGAEAAWAGDTQILAAPSLISLVNHFRGTQMLSPPKPGAILDGERVPDLRDVKGQENAKRALEIAAAGGHNLSFTGPPGSGKSMMAARLPGLLPPLSPAELLETSMIHSVAGLIAKGELTRARPFRMPHHSATMAALTGGGVRIKPGEVSLAHNGVLFLDELPEFSAQALDSLRQPLETGEVVVARANAHVRYPARFQLVAAQNPCKCGHGGPGRGACGRAPRCQTDYQMKVSGPFLDRIDLQIDVPAVSAADLALPAPSEGTAEAAARVARARDLAAERATDSGHERAEPINARAEGDWLETIADLDGPARALLAKAAEANGLTARGWTRTLRLARTIADLEGVGPIRRVHVAEALIYRRVGAPNAVA